MLAQRNYYYDHSNIVGNSKLHIKKPAYQINESIASAGYAFPGTMLAIVIIFIGPIESI